MAFSGGVVKWYCLLEKRIFADVPTQTGTPPRLLPHRPGPGWAREERSDPAV